jgi:hypothetical protein
MITDEYVRTEQCFFCGENHFVYLCLHTDDISFLLICVSKN